MEKLTKENIYIDLRGKSKEELTELWEFLNSVGENQFREYLNDFLDNYKEWIAYVFHKDKWVLSSDRISLEEKTEVTIEQLKEILQPMETLQEKEQRLLRDLEEVRKEIEESKIKVGDWVVNTLTASIFKNDTINLGINHPNLYKKITDQELINKLNELIK